MYICTCMFGCAVCVIEKVCCVCVSRGTKVCVVVCERERRVCDERRMKGREKGRRREGQGLIGRRER